MATVVAKEMSFQENGDPERVQPGGEPTATEEKEQKRPFLLRRWVILTLSLLFFGLLVFGIDRLVRNLTHQSTDDAFLDADIVAVASRIGGQLVNVAVVDNQLVEKGALLAEVDPRDYQAVVTQKLAGLSAAAANVDVLASSIELFRRQVETAQAVARQTAADAAAARATAERAEADFRRAEELFRTKLISQQEHDAAQAAARVADANLNAAQEKAKSDESKVREVAAEVGAGEQALERARAQMKQADADVAQARLNLSYTRIEAPERGRVTKKGVNSGDYVQAGQRLMAIVPENLYVVANFKETQLRKVKPGQKADVVIDAVQSEALPAHVDSIMAGSGARFSLLPPENAVGNYVKVVQRVPVKILFDVPLPKGAALGPGMSAVPSVRISAFRLPQFVVILIAAVIAIGGAALWMLLASRDDNAKAEA